jgi:uncharacterized alpha-E superfamily protein
MLSRVADALFWMSRYVERSEHVARLLEVGFHLELDLHGVVAGPHDLQWEAALEILQETGVAEEGKHLSDVVRQKLTFDQRQSSSIMSCINRARNNARSIRGSISTDMWRELNKLYWQLNDPEYRVRAMDSPHDLYHTVQIGSQFFQGVCDATLMHDEGWQFIQLGKYLERADKTLRILDVRSRQLRALSAAELSLASLHWASVLRSCEAYQSYQRLYISRVDPERVVEFLLFNRDFPHSARFCLESAAKALEAIGGAEGRGEKGKAAHIIGRAVSDLEYTDVRDVVNGSLHRFLETTWQRCAQASHVLQEEYALSIRSASA